MFSRSGFAFLWPLLLLAGLCLTLSHHSGAQEGEKGESEVSAEALVEPLKPRTMLVFSVTNGFRHSSIEKGLAALKELGEKTGAYEAVVSNDLKNFEPEHIGQFDAICFLNTTGNPFLPADFDKLSEEKQQAARAYEQGLRVSFMDHLKGGAGFVGIHAASDSFFDWPEYGEMVGGYFSGHPWSSKTPVSIQVEKGKDAHPLVAHLKGENLEFQEEIYQHREPYDSSRVEMLLRLDTEKTDMNRPGIWRTDGDFGVSWIRDWGQGRVFYCSLGHNAHIYSNPKVLQHYLAGIQYALGDLKLEE